MNVKKAITELLKSGFIPVVVGAFILFTSPNVFWGLLGLGFVVVGVFISNEYIEKSSQDNREKRLPQ